MGIMEVMVTFGLFFIQYYLALGIFTSRSFFGVSPWPSQSRG
jgi:hypothetical protein